MNTKNETMGSITEGETSDFDSGNSFMRSAVFATLALWLGLVIFLGFQGAFAGRADSPPLPIFLGFSIPLAVFFAAYFGWGAFRTFILNIDLQFVTAIQAWRWGGLGFLSLYANHVLPSLFALPAGLGDMAIGLSAPWILRELARHPSFAASRRYKTWNILGLVDFVVAISTATLCSGVFPGITRLVGNITTSPMTHLPLVLIPAYMVPFFAMLHFTALFQAQQLALQKITTPPPRP